ncbi:M15 family metallopeptidase [Sporosarcina sp. G11-34]|nr:M15 family metallopeptidase [Sporosarcina sp. G11-34]
MTALVTWVGMNNWDVEKSYEVTKKKLVQLDLKEPVKPQAGPTEVVDNEKETEPADLLEEPEEVLKVDGGGYIEGQELPLEPTYIDDILLANKRYPLPSSFAPGESKEAREHFNKMAAESLLSGYELTAFSTYRSFEYQTNLYQRYVNDDGREKADEYSARPGYSEHQTGLAFDIGEAGQNQIWLTREFGESEAGKWLAANAHRFGFIMRYPEGKEEITGYMYESWHFRYVGVEIAEEIYKQGITLEEYLKIS